MAFSSTIFMFLFLPVLLIIYFNPVFKSRKFKNITLLSASLLFYAWGEPVFLFIMCASIVLNWWVCILMDAAEGKKRRNYMLLLAVVDLGLLFVYKYLSFITQNLGLLLNNSEIVVDIVLPVGISFYTFQILSYMYDVYYGNCKAHKSLPHVALYISMFTQILSGPIVRYGVVNDDIDNREETFDDIYAGICRIIYGLGKKVIISNNIAIVADKAFELCAANELSMAMAYVGMVAYMLQLYFDFAGYSDMAIGLARIFGFKITENFDYPYISQTITEYWRRWHISLGTWFRDYVMYPILRTEWMNKLRDYSKDKWGKKVSKTLTTVVATAIVWLLTGIWHGANWTFILFGIYHGMFVILPIIFKDKMKIGQTTGAKVARIVRTLILVGVGDILFRADTVSQAVDYYSAMIGMGAGFGCEYSAFFIKNFAVLFVLGIVTSFPVFRAIKNSKINKNVFAVGETILMICILLVSISYLVRGTYNPFVYFNF